MAELMKQQTRCTWVDRLAKAGVPHSPINNVKEILGHAQLDALGLRQSIPGTDFKLIGFPVSFDGVRPSIRREAPRLGEHNRQFLSPNGEILK